MGLTALSCLQQGPKPPTQSGEPWIELKSEHFRVVSDIGEEDASHVIAGFEETYGLLGSVVFGGSAVPSFGTNAVIFEHHEDLGQFVGDGFGGMYLPSLPNDVEPSPTVLASGTLSPFARLLFTHELTHRFNHVALGPTPTWLNEGIADYYSTIRTDHGAPVVGEIDPRYMCTPDGLGDLECYQDEKLAGNRLPNASDVVGLDREGFYGTDTLEGGIASWEQKRKRTANYGVAWLLVHMLMHGDQTYAQNFRRTLGAPPSAHKGAELAEIVSAVPAHELDRDFQAYLRKRIPWRQHHAALPNSPSQLSRRNLADSEVFIWWARLDSFRGNFAGRARERLNQARQHGGVPKADGSADGAAWFWLGRYSQLHNDAEQAARHYQHALNLEPGNPDYLYGLLDLYWSDQRGMSWLEAARSVHVGKTIAALSGTARSASQLNAVAAYQLFSNDVPTALRTSAEACRVGPDCWPCFHNRAAALFAAGQAGEAANAELEALNRLSEGAPPRLVKLIDRSVDFYTRAASDPSSVKGEPRPGLVAP
jgi:tetratricopeptide (TPR) repeat protein